MIRLFYFFCALLCFLSGPISAQKIISATILDNETQETIPFVTIQFNKNFGVVTNSEGKFQLHIKQSLSLNDSLDINCLGYEPKQISILHFKDSVIKLKPKSFVLDEVIVLNKNYTVEEIIQKVSENLSENYASSFLKNKLFFRESITTETIKKRVDIKKTSIPEINQKFIDSVLYVLPSRDEIYTEILADFYTSTDKFDLNKLNIIKANILSNEKNDLSFENIEKKVNVILRKHIKRDSYFKIKSGVFGTKQAIDSSLFYDTDEKKAELLLEEKQKRDEKNKKGFLSSKKTAIVDLKQKNIIQKKSKLNFITKPNQYIYKLTGCISLNDGFAYKVTFSPKKNAKYKGVLYINTTDFAVIRADYENVKKLKSVNLLGISYSENLHKGVFIYKKNNSKNYSLKYAEEELRIKFGIKRPLKIIEKNKNVRGRRKQNEIVSDINFKITSTVKKELAVFENTVITQREFDDFKEKATVKPIKLKSYDPNFWKGYNIVEPNQAIKNFKSLDEEN